MAPKCRKMAPRWFQEPSWGPLRAILERSCPSWRELGVSGGDLGASWGDLGAILGAQGGAKWECSRPGVGGRTAQGGTPLEVYEVEFDNSKYSKKYNKKCSRVVHNTPCRASPGGGGYSYAPPPPPPSPPGPFFLDRGSPRVSKSAHTNTIVLQCI